MNPYQAYQQRQATSWTRVEMLLALFDGAIERLEAAAAAFERNDLATARRLLTRAWLIVGLLAAGLNFDYGQLPQKLGQLYDFALRRIRLYTPQGTADALRILRILREGFQKIRPEAVRLEREGVIPPLDANRGFQATA
jgi:flagellar secretion chaperone FliS